MRTVLFFAFILLLDHASLSQSSKGFLYGTITLKNSQSYTGQLRWGGQAGAWDDLFEAYKNEPQIQEQIDIQGYENSDNSTQEVFEFSFMKLWEDKESKSSFRFKCQYGHIDRITDFKDNKYVTVILKGGNRIKLRRRGNDIGEDIIMQHASMGKLEFDWKNIKEIKFGAAPGNIKNMAGDMVYGKALTVDGLLEGYVVWDYDEEAFTRDLIDGDHQKVEYNIQFGNIASLRPEHEGAIINLKNGTEVFLRNSSDVSDDNDGIFLKTEKIGMINVSWSNLISIDFSKPGFKSTEYKDYLAPMPIHGTVKTQDGRSFKGRLIYDLDETWNIEILDGRIKGTKYYIPFYLIKSITPQNYNYSLVELTSGLSLLLGEEGDVNQGNNGVLVWLTDSKTRYIPWKQIKSVTFSSK